MKRIYYLFCLMCLCTISLNAQNFEEVVYLKNGSIIHGVIIEQVPNQSIKIQTRDGNVFVYNFSDVEKITKEQIKGRNNNGSNNYNNNYNANQGDNSNIDRLSPGSAFLWSFLLPGGGQFYNGQYVKGSIMLGVDLVAWGLAVYAINDEEYYYNGNYSSYDWYGEDLFYVSMIAISANAIWSMIDAPVSAIAINRRNGLSLKYKLNKNIDLALKPDYKLDCIGGKLNPVFGAKLSFSIH